MQYFLHFVSSAGCCQLIQSLVVVSCLSCLIAQVADQEVMDSYIHSLNPGGWMYEYLYAAQMAVLLGGSLYVHAQIIGNSFPSGVVRGADETNTAWCVRVVPGEADPVNDLGEWVKKLNQWAVSQLNEWQQQPTWQTAPLSPTYEGWAGRGGAELIAYGTPGTREPTVVYSR